MRILVTGANGQLGRELKDVFSGTEKFEVIFLDRQQLPLDDTAGIYDRLEQHHPDLIVHAGAYTAVDLAETERDLADKVNHLAPGEIARYCSDHDVKLIAVSTDYVFDGNSASPLSEEHPTDPVNFYGVSKRKGEEAVLEACPEAIIIRTSWVYSRYGKNFVKTMIRLMEERDTISVIDDQIGSPTYAKDLAEAIFHIIDSDSWSPGIYHYSNEGEISWFDFAEAIRDMRHLDCAIRPIKTEEYPTPAKRPRYSLMDKTKIKNTYGLTIPQWKNSLEKMLDLDN